MMVLPTLSIIVPVFNRERLINRCLDSILAQDLTNCEVIVVDDRSNDGSVGVLKSYGDRIRLIVREDNGGVVLARNSGLERANGQWAAFVDSDDELVPDALLRIRHCLADLPHEIVGALFRCKLDDGSISPDPMPSPDILNYADYLRLMEQYHNVPHDFLYCVRPGEFRQIALTDARLEDLHCLDFHKRFRSKVFAEVARLYHQDADNQLSKKDVGENLARQDVDGSARDTNFAMNRVRMLESLVSVHGADMQRFSPTWLRQYISQLATSEFLLGRQRQGIQYSLQAIRALPWDYRSWAILLLGASGMIGPIRAARSWTRRYAKA
jgi:glycosyltransferase involved in cell wall biosynthesis